MRVGKTPQAILAARQLNAHPAIVVCPAIAVPQWQAEWKRWWPESPPPTVVSYDRARLSSPQLLKQKWKVAVVDECHFAKNPAAKRTKIIYGTGGLGWVAERLWALSGTPAPKHAGELWPMLRAFGAVKCTYDEFIRHFCYIDSLTLQVKGTKEKHIPELKALLASVMLRRTRKDVAPEMPGIGFDFLEVVPTWPADLPDGIKTSPEWLEANAARYSESRQDVAKAKVQPLAAEIRFALEQGLLKQTVVFGWHVEPLRDLRDRLRHGSVRAEVITGATPQRERQLIQEGFRGGRIQVVIANILAAGTAIDLSSARHGYFLELDWTCAANSQAANRLIAIGKNDPVTIDIVTLPGTVDDAISRVLVRRAKELRALGVL